MAALARAQGQPYAIHHPVVSSFDAHRMLHLAAEHGAASEFMDAVQRDLLGEGVNVYTAAYLADAATKAEVPAARAKPPLAGDEYAGAVREVFAQNLAYRPAHPEVFGGGEEALVGVHRLGDRGMTELAIGARSAELAGQGGRV
jgi:DSBA-like thioredoxin domain